MIGFLSELAVYKYAFESGFRIPVEGIPYLRPTVAIISMLIILLFISTFIAMYFLIKMTSNKILISNKIASRILPRKPTFESYGTPLEEIVKMVMEDINLTKKIIFTSLSSLFFSSLFIFFQKAQYEIFMSILGVVPVHIELIKAHALGALMLLFILIFSLHWSILKPEIKKFIPIYTTVALILIALSLMFNNELYEKFLRMTGFGGGKEITIYSQKDLQTISGKLLIQSNERYIILLKNNDIIEFPVSYTNRVKYAKN